MTWNGAWLELRPSSRASEPKPEKRPGNKGSHVPKGSRLHAETEKMADSAFFGVDTSQIPWEENWNAKIGRALFRKELFSDPDTGMMVRLVRYPAGVINPSHTHPCGHGMYVLEGNLVTHRGVFGPGSFVWFPEGEIMEHGASAEGDVTVVFITNKPFRIDYV